MKLRHVEIRNFKAIRELRFSLENGDSVNQIMGLLGDNGSGKTTVLQAIALTLSMATRRTHELSSFNWHGFLPERLASLGETFIELQVSFDSDEVELTHRLFEAWLESRPSEFRDNKKLIAPSKHLKVTLCFEQGRIYSPQGFEALNQFLGRYYIRAMQKERPDLREHYAKLGDIFWFDQHRNLGFISSDSGKRDREGWSAGVEQLREYLVGWWAFHTTPARNGKDYIEPLESKFQKLFPGTRFAGVQPREQTFTQKVNDFYFLLEREGLLYDLAEMSSGEQAVFPLIYEFVRLDIQRSIVLIDELELHLHPPEQQRLLFALPSLGPDCQYLLTTHSEYLTDIMPLEHFVRLERGMRCL